MERGNQMKEKKQKKQRILKIIIVFMIFTVASFTSANSVNGAKKKQYVVAIDAGHQQKGNSQLEPIGPGAKTKKAKVAGGTTGSYTKVPEYKVTLQVSKKLQNELESRGYEVIMIREKNNVNISNAERAETANKSDADIFLRIHCNGSENTSVSGALTMCQTKKNPYNSALYKESRKLSEDILNSLCKKTNAKKRSIIETDTMSGINWCEIPVTIVEMGFMTNTQEDKLLTMDSYQDKLAAGMANGVDKYFGN